jgi:endonuclease/exonuclease/phosphatase (EEP) superfamily protein YafD
MEQSTFATNEYMNRLPSLEPSGVLVKVKQLASLLVRIGLTAYIFGVAGLLILRILLGDQFWWLALINTFVIWLFLPLPIVLLFSLLLHRRRLIFASLALALIAVLWLGPTYLPKAAAQPGVANLSIVSQNVWPRNPRVSDVEAWIRQQNADVTLLQDTPSFFGVRGVPGLKDLYPYQFIDNNRQGSLILSRYPFLTTDNFPVGPSPIYIQRVTIDLNGRAVAIYNVHLSNPFRSVPRTGLNSLTLRVPLLKLAFSYDATARDPEIRDLLTLIDKEQLPYIVAGDFNTSDQSFIYNDLAAHMVDSFREIGTGLGTSWPVGGEAGWPIVTPTLIRIDYIWHSSRWSAMSIEQSPKLGSDHLGLYAELSLQPSP